MWDCLSLLSNFQMLLSLPEATVPVTHGSDQGSRHQPRRLQPGPECSQHLLARVWDLPVCRAFRDPRVLSPPASPRTSLGARRAFEVSGGTMPG